MTIAQNNVLNIVVQFAQTHANPHVILIVRWHAMVIAIHHVLEGQKADV